MHKGFKYLDIQTSRVYISRDVVFDEDIFPFAELHPNAGSVRSEILPVPQNMDSNTRGVDVHDHMDYCPANPDDATVILEENDARTRTCDDEIVVTSTGAESFPADVLFPGVATLGSPVGVVSGTPALILAQCRVWRMELL